MLRVQSVNGERCKQKEVLLGRLLYILLFLLFSTPSGGHCMALLLAVAGP